MDWLVPPKDYRDALTDFVRSGIHIHYASTESTISNEQVHIFFPYITGRQYFLYRESHLVSTFEESKSYQIKSVGEPDDETIEEFNCDADFCNWQYFSEAFNVNFTMFRHTSNMCYAFIRFNSIQFLDIPYGCIGGLHMFSNEINIDADIQKGHIFELCNNYNRQTPYYPLRMNLDWVYLVYGELLPVDTILDLASPIFNVIEPDVLISNYIITQFPKKSEAEIIENFKEIRDNYACGDSMKEDEWYLHTVSLIDKLLFLNKVNHVAKKVRLLKNFCKNRGILHQDIQHAKSPFLYNTGIDYDSSIRLYENLLARQFLKEDTLKTDFAYYMTGEGDCTSNKIKWYGRIIDLAACLSSVMKKTFEVEWNTVSQIFVDKKLNPIKANSIKSIYSRALNNDSIEAKKDYFRNLTR